MKKVFIIIIFSCILFACKTTKLTAPVTSKRNADTALQGDKLKDATKP